MAWNEPGKGKDPWGGNNNKGDGPPDLDEVWRRLRDRFGGRRGGGGPGAGGPGGPDPKLFLFAIPIIAVIWLLTGFYVVQPGEQGVVLRFGAYHDTFGPGWHWHMPYPVDKVIKVDIQQVRSASNSEVMLTRDENLVDVRVAVQYRVDDAHNYLFNLRNPDETVAQVLKSAVREIVGTSGMNQVIQEGVRVDELEDEAIEKLDLKESKETEESEDPLGSVREELVKEIEAQQESYPRIDDRSRALLPENIRKILQFTLDEYESGMRITAVNVQYSQPPEPVQGAFEEAIKAREEEERKKNIARAYAREIVEQAQGEAKALVLEARGYRERKIARASGETERFTQLLSEYSRAPEVTRKRLYLETMNEVLRRTGVVLFDQDKGSPLFYLPLQELTGGKTSASSGKSGSGDNSPRIMRPENMPSSGSGSGSSAAERLRSRDR
ncbi:HflK protein [Salinisphaera sp. PC39]|uniref:protease modulator HflK n=1 Tax=Salinisphaera sp. PC39 TaxID=1304156 RepID=UPI00333FA76C